MSEGNLLSYFNPDAAPTADYHDVSGDIFLRKDSSSDIAMGFKSPNETDKQQPGDDEIGDYIKQAKKRLSTKILNYEQSLPQSLPVPIEASSTSAAETSNKSSPRGSASIQPNKQGTVDFTYSADGDSPFIKPEVLRQVSSPMMDKVLRQFSDNLLQHDEDSSPSGELQYQEAAPAPAVRDALKEIPSNFSNEHPTGGIPQGKQRRSDVNMNSDDDQSQWGGVVESEPPRYPKDKQKPPVDSQDVAVIAAMKAKKVTNDSYLNAFPVVAGGKKKTAPDSDSEDRSKNAGRKTKPKATDSYLNEFPVVKASKEKQQPVESGGQARKLSKPRAGGDAYVNEFPVVHADRDSAVKAGGAALPLEPLSSAGAADKPPPRGVGSFRSRQIARREEMAKAREEVSGSSPQKSHASPDRIPRPPPLAAEKKRKVNEAVILPRLVQSDQTEKRSSAALMRKAAAVAPGKIIASRDDSESDAEAAGAGMIKAPRLPHPADSDDLQKVRKKKRPLYMRLEKEFQKKASLLEKEKLDAYQKIKIQKKLAQPSAQDLVEHRQKYRELKSQEELRKQQRLADREDEWRRVADELIEKIHAAPVSIPMPSPMKRLSSEGDSVREAASEDDGASKANSVVSSAHKKIKKRKKKNAAMAHSDDENSVAHEHNLYLPNIVSPAKLSPRARGKQRRKLRNGEHNKHNAHINDDVDNEGNNGDSPNAVASVALGDGAESVAGSIEESSPRSLKSHRSAAQKQSASSHHKDGDHVRFSTNTKAESIANGSVADATLSSDGTQRVAVGQQWISNLLEPDPEEPNLAKIYETGFEMLMMETGLIPGDDNV